MMWLSPTFDTANEKNAKKTAYFCIRGRAREKFGECRAACGDEPDSGLKTGAGDRNAEQNAAGCAEIMGCDVIEAVASIRVNAIDCAALCTDIGECEIEQRHEPAVSLRLHADPWPQGRSDCLRRRQVRRASRQRRHIPSFSAVVSSAKSFHKVIKYYKSSMNRL